MSALPYVPAQPRIIGPNIGPRPSWAKAVIVAEYEEDQSDSQTDYFATRTLVQVPLAWSSHTRDLFSEMRKAAATFKPTRHLGPGMGRFVVRAVVAEDVRAEGTAYWKGHDSHWHGEPHVFDTRAAAELFVSNAKAPESIWFGDKLVTFAWETTQERFEHREKYSMGSGYYLKGSCGYSTGWTVSKRSYDLDNLGQR